MKSGPPSRAELRGEKGLGAGTSTWFGVVSFRPKWGTLGDEITRSMANGNSIRRRPRLSMSYGPYSGTLSHALALSVMPVGVWTRLRRATWQHRLGLYDCSRRQGLWGEYSRVVCARVDSCSFVAKR